MRRRIIFGLLVIGALGGGWYATSEHEINSFSDFVDAVQTDAEQVGLQASNFGASGLFSGDFDRSGEYAAARGRGELIRVASFQMDLTSDKPGDSKYPARIARILNEFDVIALQGLQTDNRHELNRIVDLMNLTGGQYAFCLGPKTNAGDHTHQFAFVYDQRRIVMDTQNAYTVADPDDQFRYDPFVGWFMVRGPKESEAFTFSLVNLRLDEFQVKREINLLGQLYRAVRDDGRSEDDVMLLGNFASPADNLKYLNRQSQLDWIVHEGTTDTAGEQQQDNLIFYPAAVLEHTGRGGVYDFLKELNLTISEATTVSSHMPVWAEFRVRESMVAGPSI
jgi:hypothetical protein